MKQQDNILRIKQFSDSEEDEEDKEMDLGEADSEEMQEETTKKEKKQKSKTRKKGIVYISSIPKHMNVAICRELMERFGEVGRIFLQPDSKGSKFNSFF